MACCPTIKNDYFQKKYLWIFLLLNFFAHFSFGQDTLLLQPLNIHLQNIPIAQALDSIAVKTNCYFTYNSDLFNDTNRVTVSAQNDYLQNVLRQIFPDTTLCFQVVKKQIIIAPLQKEIIHSDSNSAVPEQSYKKISGFILDKNSGEPLPYATIGVRGKYLGTITNFEGEFLLNLSSESFQDTLIVSYVGYQNRVIPVPDIKDNSLSIKLQSETISLQEVFIRNTDPKSLIKAAMNNVEKNYPQSPAKITAFYRESVLKNNKYMIYLESVLEIYKASYKNSEQPDRAKIFKSRKTYDVTRLDTVSFRLQGGVDACLLLDIVKNIPDFLDSEKFSLFRYYFADIRIFNNQPVYVIEFIPRPGIIDPNFQGKIYIDIQSLAIVRAEFGYPDDRVAELTKNYITKRNTKTRVKPVKVKYMVSYRNINGKYYLNHSLGNLKFRVRNKRKLFARTFETSFEMASTQWDTVHIKRIKFRETLRPNTILSKKQIKYDVDFWSNQNFIQPEENIQEALKRIKKRMQQIALDKIAEE